MINKALFLRLQWRGVLLSCLIPVLTTRSLPKVTVSSCSLSGMITYDILSKSQGPFDTFLVGGDTAEVCDIKFSNDGKSMLLTTTNNNIYVLDAYGGEKVSLPMGFSCTIH